MTTATTTTDTSRRGAKGANGAKKARKKTAKAKKTAGAAKKPASAAKKGAVKPKAPKSERGMTGLDAALAVLKKAKQPLGAKEIADRAIDGKLWVTNGKTPAATLNAAMHREIREKGDGSRFKKVGRGQFAAA